MFFIEISEVGVFRFVRGGCGLGVGFGVFELYEKFIFCKWWLLGIYGCCCVGSIF